MQTKIAHLYSLENDWLASIFLMLHKHTYSEAKAEQNPICCCKKENRTFQASNHHKPLRLLWEEAGHCTLLLQSRKVTNSLIWYCFNILLVTDFVKKKKVHNHLVYHVVAGNSLACIMQGVTVTSSVLTHQGGKFITDKREC